MSAQNLLKNNHRTISTTLSTSTSHRRVTCFRRRMECSGRSRQSAENNSLRNLANNSGNENNQEQLRTINHRDNNIIHDSNRVSIQNQSTIRLEGRSSNNSRIIKVRNPGRQNNPNLFVSVYNNKKSKKINEIEEEEKKKEEVCVEENIGSEIKDTVKCYICFDKITKPKMCPHCHRIACEKCLNNWFVNLKKTKCGFCRETTNFNQMIPVPFMDAVVNFVEKFLDKNKNLSQTIDDTFLEYCPQHQNEILYYYCLDCGKAYCKTCFVFFGQEKDKHNDHSIIEYEKYKNMSFPLLKKNTEKLEKNIQHVEENIKRCLAYKNAYEHERRIGNIFIQNLQVEFNHQMDEIIHIIDDQIKKLKEYINEYDKYRKEVEDFYDTIKHQNQKNTSDKSCESLIIKLTNINQQKFFSSKELDKFIDLSKNIFVNTYQSKIGEFNHENMFLSKGLKMGTTPYEIIIDNKQRNEVQISLLMPKEKTPVNHNFQAFVFIKKKGEGIQSYDLDDLKEDNNFLYLRKKIPWDYFGQSVFKIKGVLYDFYIS